MGTAFVNQGELRQGEGKRVVLFGGNHGFRVAIVRAANVDNNNNVFLTLSEVFLRTPSPPDQTWIQEGFSEDEKTSWEKLHQPKDHHYEAVVTHACRQHDGNLLLEMKNGGGKVLLLVGNDSLVPDLMSHLLIRESA